MAAAWMLVRIGWASIWSAMGGALGILGILAVASERVVFSGDLSILLALSVGILAGLVLYVATAFFLRRVEWDALRRDSDGLYQHQEGHTLPRTLFVALLIVVPGEEFFWRGFVLGTGTELAGEFLGALLAWGSYVVANLTSGSLPIILGAVVGGLVWTGLAALSGGVLTSIACHAVWTGLMIARRPA